MKLFAVNQTEESDLKIGLITRFDIKDLSSTETYIRRWSLWLPFGWSLKLHAIEQADHDRCEHDHPWWFWRFVMSGGYWETVTDAAGRTREVYRRPGSLSYCGRAFRHRIIELPKGRAWTLLLCGGRRREWGFFTKSGWVPWRKFVAEARERRVSWCEDGYEAKVKS